MKTRTRSLVTAGLLLALSFVLPQIFHFFGGNTSGGIFLPMHIPVLLAGLLLGPAYGAVIGLAAPVLSFLITGMPPMPILVFMLFELTAYGFFSGLLYRKLSLNIYVGLVGAMLAGRVFYALGILVTGLFVEVQMPVVATVTGAVATGLPGIVIQLVALPALVLALRKAGLLRAAA